jgi:type VI protein secretion system component VasK
MNVLLMARNMRLREVRYELTWKIVLAPFLIGKDQTAVKDTGQNDDSRSSYHGSKCKLLACATCDSLFT